MNFLVVCGNREYVNDFFERPRHGSIIDGWSLTNIDLRNRVINELGCFVEVKYSGAGWHPQYGELPKIELVSTKKLE